MVKKRSVPPGGVWVLLAGEYRPGMWTAVVYTSLGEPVAASMHVRRERAERAALEEAMQRARPVRVLEEHELGDEHEELREAFAEHLRAWREADADHRDPETEYLEAFADFLAAASDQLTPVVVAHDGDVIMLDFAPATAFPASSVASLRRTGWVHELLPVVAVTGRTGTVPVSLVHLRVLTGALRRRAA
jgi:hypothetical protein